MTCFAEDGEKAHLSLRLTKSGKVHRGDVKRFLGTRYKVPLRYYSMGVRTLNPDVGWPEEVLYVGEPPEEYANIDPHTRGDLREQLVRYSPAKMTPEESRRLTWLFQRLRTGQGSPTEQKAWVAERQRILDEIAARPYDPDEWKLP